VKTGGVEIEVMDVVVVVDATEVVVDAPVEGRH
jgi:hypothetical protein